MTEPMRVSWNHSIYLFAAVVVLFSLREAAAGEYHSSLNGTLFCEDCHVVSSPDRQEEGEDYFPLRGSEGTGNSRSAANLKDETNPLCLSCHDNNPEVSDVVGVNLGKYPGMVREAGALNLVGGPLPYREEDGHTLYSEATASGSRPEWHSPGGLKCTDCHDPHGENPNGNAYRNLVAVPGNALSPGRLVSYSTGANDPSRDVFLRGWTAYDVFDVEFNEPNPARSALAEFCQGCHNDFHGFKGGMEIGGANGAGWIRHPSSDADIGRIGGELSNRQIFSGHWIPKHNYVKVMTSSGNWTPSSPGEVTDHTPTCISCHKAHGNMNPFGLIFMGNSGPVTEEGTVDGSYVDLCRQCHIQSVTVEGLALR